MPKNHCYNAPTYHLVPSCAIKLNISRVMHVRKQTLDLTLCPIK